MYDVFIISPYTDVDPDVTRIRVIDTEQYIVQLITVNKVIAYSAIIAFEHLLNDYAIPSDYVYWKTLCSTMMECAKEVHVLKLEGWEKSIGVQSEIDLAIKMNKPIKYIELVRL